ncbi:MAG: response regulator [Oceanospirillales bacterium]|uniref:Response regulator receiver domain-containing protein n=1 Tax=Marinobacterium halophilum TaxID=267374 RepID=A0A2P8ELA9_9GAMM|nr:response regulator [Marinobacterium halophilum]MBR9830437.1 response regulator [Oceanospirillales bacterium]PSL10260.1 response regulator receiver domain-containing protein [Marinobacterium halophilum]
MSKLNILVVDDARFIRERVTSMVREAFPDFNVIAVENGMHARTAMQQKQYDLILCDWEMPEMSGLEVLQWTRAQASYQSTPFLMVTSRGEREYVLKAIQSGVNDYLGKPFTREQLVQKMVKALDKRQQLSPAQQARATSMLEAEKQKQPTAAVPARGGVGKPKGLAQLRNSQQTFRCAIKDLNLREVKVVIKNEGCFPQVLEQVVVDIEQLSGDSVARLNGFVTLVQATEQKLEAAYVDVRVSFMDDDPDKLAHLSKYIASVR